jgi:hypothetical protein
MWPSEISALITDWGIGGTPYGAPRIPPDYLSQSIDADLHTSALPSAALRVYCY